MILCCQKGFVNSADRFLFFVVFDILFFRETVDQEIFIFDIFVCSRDSRPRDFVFDIFLRLRDNQKDVFRRRKTFLLIQETFDKRDFVCLGTTTVTCCDFDGASICASGTGLCLRGPRPDLGSGGCWKSAFGASLTNQQAVRDKVMKYSRATPT